MTLSSFSSSIFYIIITKIIIITIRIIDVRCITHRTSPAILLSLSYSIFTISPLLLLYLLNTKPPPVDDDDNDYCYYYLLLPFTSSSSSSSLLSLLISIHSNLIKSILSNTYYPFQYFLSPHLRPTCWCHVYKDGVTAVCSFSSTSKSFLALFVFLAWHRDG